MDEIPQNRREIGDRLREWGINRFGSVGGLGQALSIANITQYLKGEKIPGPKVQDRLREAGCAVEWLMTGKGSMHETEVIPLRRIKVDTIQTEGGIMQASKEEYAYIPEVLIEGEEPLAIRVPDDAMEGIVWKDDIVFVSQTQGASDKDLCLVRVSGEGQCIRHVFLSDQVYTLLSSNTPPRTVKRESVGSIQRVICVNIAGEHLRHK